MDGISITALFIILVILLVLSAFFSGTETGLLTLNRYRLRHLANRKHPGAMRAQKLLSHPDRIIGLILLGNNFCNAMASALAALIAIKFFGGSVKDETAITISVIILTPILIIFSEVAPKTLGALRPEQVAFPSTYIYTPMLRLLYPLVFVTNYLANGFLRLFRVNSRDPGTLSLSTEELRTVVNEAGALIPRRHQRMLLSILDLEKITVEDIMVPRNEITGIDIEDSRKEIEAKLTTSPYTKMPLYRNNIDNVLGFIHIRDLIKLFQLEEFNPEELEKIATDAYYIPEGTPLNTQLINFQRKRARVGLVVNEYGDIQGLVTLEDLLEEIVGEFTTDPADVGMELIPQEDGSYLVDGSAHVRDINKALKLDLPTNGPKTINGLIIEYLETIPESDTSLLIAGYPIEIKQVMDNTIKIIRIDPKRRGIAIPDSNGT